MQRITTALLLLSVSTACAQEDIYLSPQAAGPDYQVQGEYAGQLKVDGEQIPFGLQVIALGDHKFDAVGYPGGLPGAGWNGEEKIRASGSTNDGVTVLESDTGKAVIKDGVATISGNESGEIGVLKKVERKSPTLEKAAPANAIVLFDGSSADQFERGELVEGKWLAANCESKQKFGDHHLHIEFRTPFKPKARGQGRGNSGVYLQSRYECQVLDSFGLEGENNECGGIYKIARPAVNACFPPLTWQTYDIDFTAAKWEDGKKVQNARATIRHNGIVIHDNLELPHGTPGKKPEAEGPEALYLQGHGNPVVYRNIWVIEK